ncbi:Cyclin-dependent kinase inhibitor 5 [Hibiscus syriacus]|uniref:Cyclin-dependent kinase inhibitor 5 n=1 Tax=Hibiscus syriacus TaxID=106335 RepID=A0A6A2ZK05_HIBSY|nr:Cyclin-dependent kinase inhibitor 5 [Hibiscus syriacus]
MGKYIRKAKTAMEVSVMDVSQSSLGVRTRAKTLVLQRLQKSSTSPATAPTSPTPGSSYLQLRSRRLEKPPVVLRHHDSKRLKQQGIKDEGCGGKSNPNSNFRVRLGKDDDVGREEMVQETNGNDNIINNNDINDFGGIEASFGENGLDNEARERLVLFFLP